MQCMYDQSHQTLSITWNCSIPLGQTNIYNIKGRSQGTKGQRRKTRLDEEKTSGGRKHLWRRKTPLEEENISGGGKHPCLLRISQWTVSLPLSWSLQVSFALQLRWSTLGNIHFIYTYIYISTFIARGVFLCFLPCHMSAFCSQCICHWQLGTCFPVVSINLQWAFVNLDQAKFSLNKIRLMVLDW